MNNAPFDRAPTGRNTKDDKGKVRVRVTFADKTGRSTMKGNITRTFTINGARVSEVSEIVEQALFGSTLERLRELPVDPHPESAF